MADQRQGHPPLDGGGGALDDRARLGARDQRRSAAGVGTALPGTTLYAATKGAVLVLTKRLAFELGRHGVTVNAVLPGYTRTDMTMAGRTAEEARSIVEMLDSRSMIGRGVADPDEIATVIAFLASPESAFMTGQLLLADGGRMDYLAHV